jgi:hypothetical protein
LDFAVYDFNESSVGEFNVDGDGGVMAFVCSFEFFNFFGNTGDVYSQEDGGDVSGEEVGGGVSDCEGDVGGCFEGEGLAVSKFCMMREKDCACEGSESIRKRGGPFELWRVTLLVMMMG